MTKTARQPATDHKSLKGFFSRSFYVTSIDFSRSAPALFLSSSGGKSRVLAQNVWCGQSFHSNTDYIYGLGTYPREPMPSPEELMMLTFAWRENNLGTHIRIRLFSFNLLLKTKEIRLRLMGNVIRDTWLVVSSTYGHYAHELCVHACAFDICHYRADDRQAWYSNEGGQYRRFDFSPELYQWWQQQW